MPREHRAGAASGWRGAGQRERVGRALHPPQLRACEARCRQILGDSRIAAQSFEEVLADWPQDARLDEGLWRADLAAAYLDDGEPERAAVEGLTALRVAGETSSARTVRAVSTLLPRLRRHRDLAVMPALADTYRAALAACND